MSENDTLTRNQRRAMVALLRQRTIGDAAASIGFNERTLRRWLREPAFLLALRQLEGNAIADAVRALVVDLANNHDIMRSIRDDPNNSESVRLRSAVALDNSLLKWRELLDVEDRLASLEVAFYGQD